MRKKSRAVTGLWLLVALGSIVAVPVAMAQITPGQPAEGGFTVGDIKVEGLQRISEGTVFNYLPVNIGDRLTLQREREAIRALYATGFFRDVELLSLIHISEPTRPY